jgi:hypothetical protein
MQRRNLVFLLFFLSCSKVSFSQTPTDSTQQIKVPTIIRYLSYDDVLKNNFKLTALDTALDDIEIVHLHVRNFYNNLSNNGSAAHPQIFKLHSDVLSRFGNHSFDLYNIKPGNIRFYKTNKRYSALTYHLSGGKENQVKLTMAQNIFSNWNLGFDFKRLGSLGFMNNGTTFNSNFDAFTWVHSKNKRYNLFGSALWNSIRNKVNGGLVTDTLFNSEPLSNNELAGMTVYLSDASHKYRNHTFNFLHYYTFGFKKTSDDSARKFVPLFRLQTQSEYESGNYIYKESSDTYHYYETYNFTTPETYDSTHWDSFTNKISLVSAPLSLTENIFRPINAEATVGQQVFNYHQPELDSSRENNFAEASLFGPRDEKKIDYTLKAKYVFDGHNKDDYDGNAEVIIPLGKFGKLTVTAQQSEFSPSFIQEVYRSNHFAWDNDFDKTKSTSFGGKYELEKFHITIGGNMYSLTDYIYYDFESIPQQWTDAITIQQAFVRKDFVLGWWHLNNTVYWQNSDEEIIIPLPELASHHSLYYQSWLFKKRLFAQFGIDVHYTSEYLAPTYNPAANVFHLQDSVKTNGYILADVFFNFKIKTARVFIKLHNAGDELIKSGYYLTPHYPMPGRMFQFGLNWRFFD